MHVYSGSKNSFLYDVLSGALSQKIIDKFIQNRLPVNEAEVRSWDESMWRMYGVLGDGGIASDVEVAIEYQIPLTAKRVDFMIAGSDESGQDHVVIIELKQWEHAEQTSRPGIVMTYVGGGNRAVVHPSYQAYSYAKTIENFNATVQSEAISLHPCAYLHNYERANIAEIDNPSFAEYTAEAPVFIKDDAMRLAEFIKKFVPKRDRKGDLLYRIDQGKIRPSKSLQDALAGMLNQHEEFVLLDEQKVAYETVLKVVQKHAKPGNKAVVIIEGGPGTGKSVVAINLLAKLTTRGYTVNYTSKNSAPRKVYFDILKGNNFKMGYAKSLFKYSGSYMDVVPDTFDCLLVDEAHRLSAKTQMGPYTKGDNQIKEIISAAKTSVFFIDENQKVTSQDIGSVAEIKKWAAKLGAEVIHSNDTNLVSQFRCNGSNSYLEWVDAVLGFSADAHIPIEVEDYDLRIFDDIIEMRETLRAKNTIRNKARMVAGYCWDWVTKSNPDVKQYDIVIGDFKAKWNFDSTDTWAIDADSFDQVGCIHTSQGLEFDYVGVIVGEDIATDGNAITAHPENRASSDYSLKGLKGRNDLADLLIRNTYKTLMTRGMKGCYIYCHNAQLRSYLRNKIAQKSN